MVASNLANADTVAGPDGQAYKARQVVFQTALMGAGIEAIIVPLVSTVADADLDRPTPCGDMDLAALLAHVDGLSQAFAAAARKDFSRALASYIDLVALEQARRDLNDRAFRGNR